MSNSSKLVSLITERYGLVKVMARGARRTQSKYGAALEPVTLIDSIYYHRETREIQNISDAEIIDSFSALKSDIKMLTFASCMVEITQLHTAPEDPSAGTFELLMDSLGELNTGTVKDADKHLWRFMLRLLAQTGYSPSLDKCLMCGRKPQGRDVFVSFSDGGFICQCTDPGSRYGMRVSPGALMIMKDLMTAKAQDISRLRMGQAQRSEVEKLILQFLSYHSGSSRLPRSLAFLKKIS